MQIIIFGLFFVCPAIFFVVLYALGQWYESLLLKRLGGISLVLQGLLLLMIVGSFAWSAWVYSNPVNVYKLEVGSWPSSEIQGLKAQDDSFGDMADVRMKFQAPVSVVQQLVKLKHLKSTVPAKIPNSNGNHEEPDWWLPKTPPGTKLYSLSGEGQEFRHEERYLLFDPRSQMVYYWFRGID